jgi:hypothetical protein
VQVAVRARGLRKVVRDLPVPQRSERRPHGHIEKLKGGGVTCILSSTAPPLSSS